MSTLNGETKSADTLIAQAEDAVGWYPFDPHLRNALGALRKIVGRGP